MKFPFSTMPKIRFFYLNEDHLNYREVRLFRTKLSLFVTGLTVFLLVALLFVNNTYYDFLRLGVYHIRTLTRENEILQQQLKKLTAQMIEVEKTLDHFGERTNELRLLVDLPRFDEDTRSVGIGGRSGIVDRGIFSSDAQQLLGNSSVLLDKIVREIQLQKMSYDEIYRRYQYNKEFFACMPALKPMEGYYSITGFGLRMHPVLGIYKTHSGLDIIADVGASVFASGDGVVEHAKRSGGGYGNAVLISHGYGYQSLYAHLSKILVHEGQKVKRGDLIAISGKTGLVSGPHLHYEVHYRGVKQNPIDYFLDDVLPQNYKTLAASRN